MELAQAVQEFLVAARADGLQETTLSWYESMLKVFGGFFPGEELQSVTTAELRRYIIHIRDIYAEDSAHGHIRVQHRFWKWCAAEYGLVNPMRNIKYPALPKQKTPKAADAADMFTLFDHFDDSYQSKRDKAILAFLADTGCRVTGLCTLTTENLDVEKRQAVVQEKGRKSRKVVFTEFTANILKEWMQARAGVPYVFYSLRTMQPLTRSGVEQIMKRLRKQAGVKGRTNPHAFRHAFAREYLKAGGDLATLSKLLGHNDIATTAAYYALFTSDELAELHEQYSPLRNMKD